MRLTPEDDLIWAHLAVRPRPDKRNKVALAMYGFTGMLGNDYSAWHDHQLMLTIERLKRDTQVKIRKMKATGSLYA